MGRHLKGQFIPDRAPVGQRNGSVKSVSQRVYQDSRQEHGKGMYGLLFLIALIQSLTEQLKERTACGGSRLERGAAHHDRQAWWQEREMTATLCLFAGGRGKCRCSARFPVFRVSGMVWGEHSGWISPSIWKLPHRNTQRCLLGVFCLVHVTVEINYHVSLLTGIWANPKQERGSFWLVVQFWRRKC